MTRLQKLSAIPLAAVVMLGGGALAGYATLADAQTAGTTTGVASTMPHGAQGDFKGMGMGRGGPHGGKGHGVHGTVSAVNGSTITVTGKDGQTYTVNAGSATVQRMVTGSVSDITVGDTIGVQGTVSGTSVTATTIMDGIPTPSVQQ